MNATISQAYGIAPYGKNGMEIIRNGQQVAKFTARPTQEENWQDAVSYARGERHIISPDTMTVREFVEKFQKHERLHGRGDDYAEIVIKSSEDQYTEMGYTLISRHESITGQVVFYGIPEWM